jgi:hypothetical protein
MRVERDRTGAFFRARYELLAHKNDIPLAAYSRESFSK